MSAISTGDVKSPAAEIFDPQGEPFVASSAFISLSRQPTLTFDVPGQQTADCRSASDEAEAL